MSSPVLASWDAWIVFLVVNILFLRRTSFLLPVGIGGDVHGLWRGMPLSTTQEWFPCCQGGSWRGIEVREDCWERKGQVPTVERSATPAVIKAQFSNRFPFFLLPVTWFFRLSLYVCTNTAFNSCSPRLSSFCPLLYFPFLVLYPDCLYSFSFQIVFFNCRSASLSCFVVWSLCLSCCWIPSLFGGV